MPTRVPVNGSVASRRRAEADAAALEASDQVARLAGDLDELNGSVQELTGAREELVQLLAAARHQAEAAQERHDADRAELHEELLTTQARLLAAEQDRDAAAARTEEATSAQAAAEEQSRASTQRADAQAARADRNEQVATKLRADLEQATTAASDLRDQLAAVRGDLAVASAQRDAARADIDREQAHGDQRVTDLQAAYDRQLSQGRDELDRLRDAAQQQRSRADRAETRLARNGTQDGDTGRRPRPGRSKSPNTGDPE